MADAKPINPRTYILFSDKVRAFYESESASLERIRLKPSQARVLHFIADFEGLSQQEAGKFFGLKPSTMSGLLSSVEEEGYIFRETNPKNKRMVMIRLTPKGKQTAKQIYQLFQDYCSRCLADFSPQECASLEAMMTKFANAK